MAFLRFICARSFFGSEHTRLVLLGFSHVFGGAVNHARFNVYPATCGSRDLAFQFYQSGDIHVVDLSENSTPLASSHCKMIVIKSPISDLESSEDELPSGKYPVPSSLDRKLDAIAVVFFGMTMSRQGEPRVFFTLIGVLILGILDNGLTQIKVDSYIREILVGFIVIAAVAIASFSKHRN